MPKTLKPAIHCIPLHDIPPGLQIVGAPIPVLGPTATLSGRVTDPSGAIIAGVKVEATNVEANILFSGETNAEGRYHIPDFPPGMYRVIVRKFAFQTIVKPLMAVRIEIAPSLCRLNESLFQNLRFAIRALRRHLKNVVRYRKSVDLVSFNKMRWTARNHDSLRLAGE
jgi:hypothetical protein